MSALINSFLRAVARRGRIITVLAFGALAVVVALALRGADDPDAGAVFINAFGLAMLVPIGTLLFAGSAFGDLYDDQTLVYLWLKPIARLKIVASAMIATAIIAVPITVVPISIAAASAGSPDGLVPGTVLASLAGSIAYVALFVTLGAYVRRSMIWGLLYILLWEAIIAGLGTFTARLSVRGYSQSLLSAQLEGTNLEFTDRAVSQPVAWMAIAIIVAVCTALTTRRLLTTDVP